MLSACRVLLFGALTLTTLSGCGSSSYGSSRGASNNSTVATVTSGGSGGVNTGSGTPARQGTDNLIVATPSGTVATVIGSRQTLSITFNSSDGRPMTGFAVSGTLGTLPKGWSGPSTFVCTSVSTGSDCVLNLTYAPSVIDSGTLNIGYVVVDNSGMPRTDGSLAVPYAATAYDNVNAAAAPTGQIVAAVGSGSESVGVTFTTDDGNAATALTLTTDLSALPPGWSGPPLFSCSIVSTGSGCVLGLTYAPTVAGSGTLVLTYSYLDDSGAGKTGTLNIPYATAASNSIIATASPAGQIIAAEKSGGQVVPITFTTDDGKAATGLTVTSDLAGLTDGWSSATPSFACSSVSVGNGCQLSLRYAPTALDGGLIALHYKYVDGSGSARSGLLNLGYVATTDDNVVGTPSPSGQINAVVGMGSQPVTVTFTTDDARPATALRLTGNLSTLPAGWSSTATSLTCNGLNVNNACQLPLVYAPTAAGAGTLNLTYAYDNNAGRAKSGSVSIAYRATTDDSVSGTPMPGTLAVRNGSSTTVAVTFATDDGNPASLLSVTAGLDSLPAGWSAASNAFDCASVSAGTACTLSLIYAPTAAANGSLTLGFGYSNDSGIMKTGTVTIGYSSVP